MASLKAILLSYSWPCVNILTSSLKQVYFIYLDFAVYRGLYREQIVCFRIENKVVKNLSDTEWAAWSRVLFMDEDAWLMAVDVSSLMAAFSLILSQAFTDS